MTKMEVTCLDFSAFFATKTKQPILRTHDGMTHQVYDATTTTITDETTEEGEKKTKQKSKERLLL